MNLYRINKSYELLLGQSSITATQIFEWAESAFGWMRVSTKIK